MAQLVDLRPKPLEHRCDSFAQGVLVVEVAGVREFHTQRAHALDALVVDLPGPAGALALTRLHAVAQAFDLHRALRHQALRALFGEQPRCEHLLLLRKL